MPQCKVNPPHPPPNMGTPPPFGPLCALPPLLSGRLNTRTGEAHTAPRCCSSSRWVWSPDPSCLDPEALGGTPANSSAFDCTSRMDMVVGQPHYIYNWY